MAASLQLPVDAILADIVDRLRRGPNLVVEAPPGAGKTTRVPTALLDVVEGEIVCLQPRRLPARLAARRVAEERGEEVGQTIGYQVRFEEMVSAKTRVRFVTEGILGRRLLSDPQLRGVGAVVLDEFHERHLQGDLGLALLRRLQRTQRPELRLVVMSATLEAEPVRDFLGCDSVRSEGRLYPIQIEHTALPDDRRLADQVASAVRRLVAEGLDGDVLVFLPGAGEITRAREACEELARKHDLILAVLHGELPPAEQDRAVRTADRRKIIFSTNVAESSVTIEGVRAVVDSGLARVAAHSPFTGLPSLRVQKISQASAAQRAGRAGRTGPGRCLRLYTQHDHDTRPRHDAPEVKRLDLAEPLLELAAAGAHHDPAFAWFEEPLPAAREAAEALLRRLGAMTSGGALTDVGRRMLRLPLHPRLSRIVVEGERRGVAEDACRAAALLGERDIRARGDLGGGRRQATTTGDSDVLDLFDLLAHPQGRGVDRGAVQAVERVSRQLARLAEKSRGPRLSHDEADAAVRRCLLAGFPDRVARRRRAGGRELLLSGGGALEQDEASIVRDAELVVVVDAEERRVGTSSPRLVARSVSAIDADWLLDLEGDAVRESREVGWNTQLQRVEVVTRLLYDEVVLDESRRPPAADNPADATDAARVLATQARAAGLTKFVDADELERWLARVDFVARTFPEAGFAPPGDESLLAALTQACTGLVSFAELRDASLLGALKSSLPGEQARKLAELAPERVNLGGGRGVRVEYERDKPPWVASRMQDFFGMADGPRVGGGRVPVVLHLNAPNGRAQQVTTDLAGFWTKHYPAIRKELMRKYPRHSWPEDPRHAAPPPPKGR